MKLVLDDKSEITLESYENITAGESAGGVKIKAKGTLDDLMAKISGKTSTVSIMLDNETAYTASDLTLGKSASKDFATGVCTISLVPKTLENMVKQNASDITAINEAIADLADVVSTATAAETKEETSNG